MGDFLVTELTLLVCPYIMGYLPILWGISLTTCQISDFDVLRPIQGWALCRRLSQMLATPSNIAWVLFKDRLVFLLAGLLFVH